MADTPSRGGRDGSYLDPYQVSVSWADPRTPAPKPAAGSGWFGPLAPMHPVAPEGVEGRQFDYRAGYNLSTTHQRVTPTTFGTLRALADGYDLLRIVIETRKDQARRLDWHFRTRDRHSKDKREGQIDKAYKFFEKPDGYHSFSEWMSMLLEDMFVIDAAALYKHRNRGGALIGLLPIDGSTIKPVIDNFGRTPLPYRKGRGMVYPVAYQQILKGMPAVNYSTRDLLYKPRNVRTTTPYGFSPVEQILATVNIALRRQTFTTAYFSEGSIPDALIGVPETWTPDQLGAFQQYWDAVMEGDAGRRRKAKFVPGGVAKTFIATKEPDLKAEFDDWLSRIVCFAFSVSPQALIKQVNRASSETQKASAEEEGLVPVMQWFKELVDGFLIEIGAPDIEFIFSSEDSIDESAQAVILDGEVKVGIISLNEARIKRGYDPIDDPAFDKPKVYTASGFVEVDACTLEGIKARAEIESKANPPAPKGTGPGNPAATTPKVQTGPSATARKVLGEVEETVVDV